MAFHNLRLVASQELGDLLEQSEYGLEGEKLIAEERRLRRLPEENRSVGSEQPRRCSSVSLRLLGASALSFAVLREACTAG